MTSADRLRSRLPEGLELELFEGKAWLGLIPFDMQDVTLRGCPAPSALCDFPELNVRTYVIRDGKPGVWFFSLDVPNASAVWAARTFFHLPYFKADMAVKRDGDRIHYRHRRQDLRFEGDCRPAGEVPPVHREFAQWATERYCLYCADRKGRVYRGDIHHKPWPLRAAQVGIHKNSLLEPYTIGARHPSSLFSPGVEVVVFPLAPCA